MWEPECTSSVFLITLYQLTPQEAGRLARPIFRHGPFSESKINILQDEFLEVVL